MQKTVSLNDAWSQETGMVDTVSSAERPSTERLYEGHRNNSWTKLARFRRQTIHVCDPDVSTCVCRIPLVSSHEFNFRFEAMSPSSVPHEIQRSRVFAFASEESPGKTFSKSSFIPPELNAPIQAKRSRLLSPANSDSAPPMESPAIARDPRSARTR